MLQLIIFAENQNGTTSPKLNLSRDSVANAVRQRRLRRLERPLSLADAPSSNVLLSILQNRSYSINFDESNIYDKHGGKDRLAGQRGVTSSHSTDELGEHAAEGETRRAASLVDVLLRRKRTLRVACHVIENPMHAGIDDDDANTG